MNGLLNRLASTAALILACTATSAQVAPHDISQPPENTMTDQDDEESVGYTEKPQVPVQETALPRPPIDGFGTFDANNGGLPANIWAGSSRDTLDFPMSQIGTGITNETLHNLLVKLLMTSATPPQGRSDINWLALRVSVLLNIGQDDKVLEIIGTLPSSIASQHMQQLQTELELAHGDVDKGCKEPRPDATKLDEKSTQFWQKLNILCQAHAGKLEEASVGLDVLRETNAGTPLFAEEIHRINDKNYTQSPLPKKLSLLDFAVIRMAGDTLLLKDHMDALPSIAVKYLAEDSDADLKLREKATTHALQLGLLPSADTSKLPEPPFVKSLQSDVTTLVTALGSGNPPNDDDNAVIARLALDDAGMQDSRRIERLLSLMQLFGYKVPESQWEKLFSHKGRFDGEVPPAIWLDELYQASTAGRKGEVIILSAVLFGSNDADKVSDLILLPVVKALKTAGFEKEAREIAYAAVKSY